MVNNLTLGLDHKIYGSASGNGGTVRRADDPDAPGRLGRAHRLPLRPGDPGSSSRHAAPTSSARRSTTGATGSSATSRTRSRSRSCRANTWRGTRICAVPQAVKNIAGSPVPIFRISPVERWRQIRSSRRIAHGERSPESAGASHHVVDAGAGVTIYRGSAYPAEFYGNAFVGDAQNNLIHRLILIPDGPTFQAVSGARERRRSSSARRTTGSAP